jgi:Biotin-lipoyl like/HlyD family secretion protein
MRQQLLTIAAYVGSADDLEEVARGLVAAVVDLLPSCRAYCVFYDAQSRTLWSEHEPGRQWDAARGVIGHAAQHRWAVCLDVAPEHPAYDRTVDDPDSLGITRMLVQPISTEGDDVHALLVVIRHKRHAPFTADECTSCALLARYVAPMLAHVAIREAAEIDAGCERRSPFREQALADHRYRKTRGDLIRVTPRWLVPAGWSVAVSLLVGLVIAAFAEVDHYSTGIGIVRAGNRKSLICRESGTLEEVLVDPGDRVVAGQVLARLDAADLRAELARLDAEFHAQLRNRMREPSDEHAGQGVLTLRGELEVAQSRVREREIRAPHDGVVADLRGRPGQPCGPGDTVLTMTRPDEPMELIALLPGDDRPQLGSSSMIRFELPGYHHEYQWFQVTGVDDAVIGPTEAARVLGRDTADVVPHEGARVLVRATIPRDTFVADGISYAYHDGMYGQAEVRLRREPLLHLLLPESTRR